MRIKSMKKVLAVSMLLGCFFALAGCGVSKTDTTKSYEISKSGAWKDGAYTETAKGKKGNFEVTVVIRDGSIESVTVGDNQETPGKGDKAIAQIPEEIVGAQTFEVDAVSGATVTSDGIKDAVAKCLEKASK